MRTSGRSSYANEGRYSMNRVEKISITDRAVDEIRRNIEAGVYAVGDKLPSENLLCSQLGVSRTTIREAQRVLQAQGYVDIIHGRGAFVASLDTFPGSVDGWALHDSYKLTDIYPVRRVIEDLGVRLAAVEMTDREIDELASIHQQFVNCVDNDPQIPDKAVRLAMLDEAFHEKICEGSHNPLIIKIIRPISESLRCYRKRSFAIEDNLRRTPMPHGKILEAIRNHQPAIGAFEMNTHLDISAEDIAAAWDADGQRPQN